MTAFLFPSDAEADSPIVTEGGAELSLDHNGSVIAPIAQLDSFDTRNSRNALARSLAAAPDAQDALSHRSDLWFERL